MKSLNRECEASREDEHYLSRHLSSTQCPLGDGDDNPKIRTLVGNNTN